MSERRHAAAGDGEQQPEDAGSQPKVVDRRRFTPEGDPIEVPGAEPAGVSGRALEGEARGADERDATIAEQAARIEELARGFAGLVEDNKAFRQRVEREKERIIEAERFNVAQALLEASDDLDRALAAVSEAGDGGNESLRGLVEGVRLSLGALQKRIAGLGAERIAVVGQPFDPRVAEAIDTVAVADEGQDGIVLYEVRPGYRVGGRVLRPARVRVGRLARA